LTYKIGYIIERRYIKMDKQRVKPALTDEELDKVTGGESVPSYCNYLDECDESPTGKHEWAEPEKVFTYCIHCNAQRGVVKDSIINC
jgi:hypothetical protein